MSRTRVVPASALSGKVATNVGLALGLDMLLVFDVLLHDFKRSTAYGGDEVGVSPKGVDAGAADLELVAQGVGSGPLEVFD